jgi:hypothetical protein
MPDDYKLSKWDIVHVWCGDLRPPHHKYCICICPYRHWYLFINSDPPFSRRAKAVVVVVENFELHCIKHTSYVDTTFVQQLPGADVAVAIATEAGRRGALPPFLRKRVIEAVGLHNVLSQDEIDAIVKD